MRCPGQVPAAWLIPPQVFESDYPLQRFPDVAPIVGLDIDSLAGGVIMDDFDGDGSLDLVMSSMGVNDQVRFFRNNGDGSFSERTEEAGLLSFRPTQTATWFDFNSDGWLDVLIANETVSGDLPQPCELFRNNGDGTFTDIAVESGLTSFTGMLKAVVNGDYNNDGRPDVYISWHGHDNLLLRNDGPVDPARREKSGWRFTEVAEQAGVTEPIYSFPSWFFDYDNDGWLDFYLSTGNPNLSTLVPNRILRNAEGKFFQDVTTAGGFGHLQKGHGVAFGDLDNDGDQDIYHVLGGAYEGDRFRNALWENPGDAARWITLRLEGTRSNRAAIGARIKVVVGTAKGERQIFRTVGSGGSFRCSPLRAEIGLGKAQSIRAIEIYWPVTGQTQTITNVALDRFYQIREGDARATPWQPKQFRLPARQDR